MVQNITAEPTRRSRGRPQVRADEETRALIIEAAREEFGARGFAATCMADVAQRAGVSTKTLYRLIPTKSALFTGVISERIGRFVLEADHVALDKLDAEAALERILIAFGTLTLEAGTIAMTRLVIGEARAFPEIGAAFSEMAIQRTSQAMEATLHRLCARGLIQLDDPAAATSMLRGMMIMEPQRAVMLGRREPPDADEIAARAKGCAKLFLRGCAVPAERSRAHLSEAL